MPAPTSHDVRTVRFVTTRLREGYDPAEVDALLERIAVTLDDLGAGRVGPRALGPDDVLNAKFGATKFRDGYDQDQVDDFLDTVVLALRARRAAAQTGEQAGRPGAPGGVAAAAQGGAWVRDARAQLASVRLTAGYSTTEVDDVLDRAATELDGRRRGGEPRMTAADVRGVRFAATWWRAGYARSTVDVLLDEVAAALGE